MKLNNTEKGSTVCIKGQELDIDIELDHVSNK